jgi:hypothetical protein
MSAIRTQTRKESRAVFPLWLLVALAGLIPRFPFQSPVIAGLWEFLSVAGFYAGIPLLATLPLGYEFQSKTFSSLLAQPADRRRIWATKMLVVGLTVLSAGFAYLFGWQAKLDSDRETIIVATVWLVMTACSAIFWTLLTRSVTGGLMLNVVQGVVIVIGFFLTDLLRRRESPFYVVDVDIHRLVVVWIAMILIYSFFMLWLGRRALVRFQDRGSETSDFLSGRPRLQPRLFAGWLRSRPNAPLFNLVAKEIRLLWPVWVFTLFGIFATATMAMWRLYTNPGPGLFTAVSVTEVVVASLCAGLALFLSGTLSMSEERTLGVQAWHMTVPMSFRTQWLLKFVVVLGASTLAMGPLFVIGSKLVRPTFPMDVDRLLDPALLWIVALTVVLGFWCGSAVKGTSRALMWLCPVMAMVFFGAKFGIDLSLVMRSGRLLNWVGFDALSFSTQIQALLRFMFHSALAPAVTVLAVLLTATVQSYRLFRIETRDGYRSLLRALVPLFIAALLGGFAQETLDQFSYRFIAGTARSQRTTIRQGVVPSPPRLPPERGSNK